MVAHLQPRAQAPSVERRAGLSAAVSALASAWAKAGLPHPALAALLLDAIGRAHLGDARFYSGLFADRLARLTAEGAA